MNPFNAQTYQTFAGHLARGRRPERAAELMGYAPDYGRAMLSRLRRMMGEQAR